MIDWQKFPFKFILAYKALDFSLSQLDKALAHGSLTENEYKWRKLFWTWSAPRFEGEAGKLQDRCYNAFGLAGVDKRIERIKVLRQKYIKFHYGRWMV